MSVCCGTEKMEISRQLQQFFCQNICLWVSNPGRGFVNLYWRTRSEDLKSNFLNFNIHIDKNIIQISKILSLYNFAKST